MLKTSTPPPNKVLLRLPQDLAAQLARAVPPRQRNRYIVDLLVQDLRSKQTAQSRMLAAAATQMNRLEAEHPALVEESAAWTSAALTDGVDNWDSDFDRNAFEREWAETQAAKAKPKATR